jgi:anti-sigma regulatory factor (Ser/Thr protein kinase)
VLEGPAASGPRHLVLFYRDAAEYRARLNEFVNAAAAAAEPVLVAIPQFPPFWPDSPDSAAIRTADMTELGRNPARVVPALRAFCDAHAGKPVRIVTESIWPGRSDAEVREAIRHEALIELALAGLEADVLCPYNAALLPRSVLADARRVHRWQFLGTEVAASAEYEGPGAIPAWCQVPLPNPPPDADAVEYSSDLRRVRAMVTAAGERAGLTAARATDLMIAVSEVAANTLRHTAAGGVALAWRADGEILCQVTDSGHIADPLAGLRRPPAGEPGGQGLWLVNQVCDLVEVRSTAGGTSVRMHMRIRRP